MGGGHYRRVVLLAEDLLLLLTDDDSGKTAVASSIDVALGGALLTELAILGRVDVAGEAEQVRQGRIVVRDASATSDPLLDEALATTGEMQGKKPHSVVEALGKHVRARLYDRLVERGMLRAESGRILGVFPRRTWPAQDSVHEDAVRADLVTALQAAETNDARTGALVSLLLAVKAVHVAVRPDAAGMSKRELNASAKRIARGQWAPEAVRRAVEETVAAVTVVIAAAASSGAVVG